MRKILAILTACLALTYNTVIYGPDGQQVASEERVAKYLTGRPIEQTFIVENPGNVTLKVNAKGLQSASLTLPVE